MAADLQKAIADAKASEELAALVAAVVRQLPAAAPAAPACSCQHHAPAPAPSRGSAARPLAIGAAVVCGACAFTALFLAVALASVGVAVGAVVLFLLVREIRRGGAR